MSLDGYARWAADRADVLIKRSESVARLAPDAVRLEMIPAVNGDRVMFAIGDRWMVYGIGLNRRGELAAFYVPEQSRPLELIDPAAEPLCHAALDAWLKAGGDPDDRPINWSYAPSVGRDLPAEERLTVRALQALDLAKRGTVTATRRLVSEVRERLRRDEGL